MVDCADKMHDFNATSDTLSDNCSEPEVNSSSGTMTSSDGGNCTPPSEGVYTSKLGAERHYQLAVVCCGIVAASVLFNGALVNRLLRRGGRLAVDTGRSFLLLNLVVVDCVLTSGSCGMLAAALFGGRWPHGDVGCRLYSLSTIFGNVASYYTLASFIVERLI